MAETQSTSTTTTTEATAPTGDIKVFIDAFNKDFDVEIKRLTDAQQNYKNAYADAIKISTPKEGPWPNDPKVVTIGDLFKYTFPDIESDKIIRPDNRDLAYDPKKREDYFGWTKDLKDSKDEKISKMYDTISNGIRSNSKLLDYQNLKKPGITNPNLWSPGQYYFDVFMSRMLSESGPLKDPDDRNGGANGLGTSFDKESFYSKHGGSASVTNFDPSGEVEYSKRDSGDALDYSNFHDILSSGYVGSGIKYKMVDTTGVEIGGFSESFKHSSARGIPTPPSSFPSLRVQYKSGILSQFLSGKREDWLKNLNFNPYRGSITDAQGKDVDDKVAFDDNTDKSLLNFNGNYEHILLYKAFVQAGDNYKSVVLPLRNPEPPIPETTSSLVKVQPPQEVGYTFNVEKKDSFVIVGGSMSGMEFTIVPNDGTTYITNEASINKIDDEDMLSDEYSEAEFLGIEDTATKVDYAPSIDDKQAVITDTATLNGPVEITKPKDGSMTVSSDGLKRLKKHEGSRATVYDDKTGKGISSWDECAGFPTIGVGHLIQNNEKAAFSKFLKPGKMSDNEIDNLLLKDLQERINGLNKKLKIKVSQNQFDSLLSMMFNTGGANKSFLKAVSLTNEGKFKDAAAQIKSGPKTSKGVVLAGLERRRNEEAETYLA